MSPEYKSCEVVFRQTMVYIFGYTRTPYGNVANTPCQRLELAKEGSLLGARVIEVFNLLSPELIEVDIPAWRQKYDSHLRDLGFKSWSMFSRNAKSVSVELQGNRLTLIPSERDDTGSFVPLTEFKRECELDGDLLTSLLFEMRDRSLTADRD